MLRLMPEFEPFSRAECRALVRAAAFERAGALLTASDGIKLVTVTKLVNRGLMERIERPPGATWAARPTDDGKVVARALSWWTPADGGVPT